MAWALYGRLYDSLWDHALTDAVVTTVVRALPAGMPVIEVGAGTGLVARRLVDRGIRVVEAAEPHSAMRARLQARCADITVTPRSIADLEPPPDGSSQAIVASHVLHIVDDPGAAVDQLKRAAGSSGVVFAVVPRPDAGVLRVVRAMTREGIGWRRCAWFILAHVLLAPIAPVLRPRRRAWPDAPQPVADIAGVSVLIVHRSSTEASLMRE